MTDLTEYTLPQLKQLQARIAKEVAKRENDSKAALLKRLRKLARDEGVELEDLLGKEPSATPQAKGPKRSKASKPLAAKKAPIPAKYRNPNNLDQGWSGRGRKPAWFEAWVRNGGSVSALEHAATLRKTDRPKQTSPADKLTEQVSELTVAADPATEAPAASPSDI